VIVFAAVLIGVETSETLMARYGPAFDGLELVLQVIFVAEIGIRLLAYWPRLGAFFRGWNVFDFVVVAASLLPQAGAFAMVARLARLMRVTRLVSVFPELRLIVGTMLRSIPSMGHVIILLGLLLYVYAVLGFYLYFGSFIFVGVFVVISLFIAVVINNLESVKGEQQVAAAADRDSPHRTLLQTIEDLRARLEDLERQLRSVPTAAQGARTGKRPR
jgi:voltage-gated sodium channel